MINLESVETFVCIVEAKSFRAASKMMHKSQPVLTYHIRQLEAYLGYELFDRSHYRIQLTPHGQHFLPKALRMLETATDIERQRHNADQYYEPQLSVSVSSLYPLNQLIQTLHHVQTQFPETKLQLSTDTLSGHEKVQKKKVDLAITEFAVKDIALQQEPIFEFNMVLVISSTHPINSIHKASTADLLHHPQIVLRSSGTPVEDRGILSASKQWGVSDMHAKTQLIKQGLGWGYLPDYILNDETHKHAFTTMDITELPATPITLYKTCRHYQEKGPVLRTFWDAIKTHH